jgi:glycosyltransferase involved in cell wall biosynthesis
MVCYASPPSMPAHSHKKILHVINSAGTGGAQTLIESMALYRLSGDEVRLLVLQGPASLSKRLEAAFDSVDYVGMADDTLNPLSAIRGLGRAVRKHRPDVVHSHIFVSDLISLLTPVAGAARVSTVHQSGLSASDPRSSSGVVKLVGLGSQRFGSVVATSEAAAQFMQASWYRREPTLIHNGVPIPETIPPYDPSSVTLVSLARWHPMKAHDVLFEAFRLVKARVPGAKLVCAGERMTVENPELLALVNQAGASVGDDVQLLGPVGRVGDVLEGAACLVLSSTGVESWPMVGGEATAHGVPVITTDIGETATFALVPEHLVPPGSPELLAEAITDFLLLPPDRRLQLSHDARAKAVSEFSVSRVVEKYDAVYESCLETRDTRA